MSTNLQDLPHWVRLLNTEGVGPVLARALLSHFGLPEQIFEATYSALVKVVPERVARALLSAPDARLETLIQTTREWAALPGNHVITLADAEYPQVLLDIADPPAMLYAKGRIELLSDSGIAIVGSRNASVQGMQDAQLFAESLAGAGLPVISGLALGIDAAAHLGALQAAAQGGSSTIAVIGTGMDIVYPARNRGLAHRVAAEGLLLSEYALGTPAMQSNFPRRNRVISGLSCGVLVVEAAAHSGSLITARMAADQGRDVFAIPGSIHSPLSKGCHQLIRQGAKLVESAQDVLEELRPARASVTRPVGNATPPLPNQPAALLDLPPDLQALMAAMGFDPVDVDSLTDRVEQESAAVVAGLLSLEMRGLVESLPGARYRRLS